jgi:molybdopterin converting factor small subunit
MLRQIAGRSEAIIERPSSGRLADLLETLAHTYPGILGMSADYQWRHGSSHVMIALNGVLIEGESQDLQLSDGDEVSLVPPLGGGLFE